MGTEIQAWVTSAVGDKTVEKAIVLAASLRRVFTSKPIAVLTTNNVSNELKQQLEDTFDHVQVIEAWAPNGFPLEEYVKVKALGLKFFTKCVYLSPESIILRNCDDIFEIGTFAASRDDFGLDTSVFLYSPSLELARTLEKSAKEDETIKNEDFSHWFLHCLEKNLEVTTLNEKYNLKVNLAKPGKSLNVEASIATFCGLYPTNIEDDVLKNALSEVGPVEKNAVNTCLKIYSEVCALDKIKINRSLPGMSREPVAIVGLSFRLPGGNNEEEFWNLLENGQEGIKPLPPFRWTKEHSLSKCYDRSIEAGFLDFPVDEFDSKFFGFSPKEAEFLDPQQRLLHEVAWEALEDAMIDPNSLCGTSTGFFVGSWVLDYQDFCKKIPGPNKFRSYMGTSLATEAARLSHFFQTTGPSIGTESGCSSSIVAVHLACKSLQKHETNLAIACGVNLLLHPIDFGSLGFVLSKDGRCKTFDASADGFGRAEACNVLILKRLSDAVKDGDNIWGLIRGSAVTQEGVSKSLGTPTVHCESLAMKLALKDSGVDAKDVDYIETHGTGTAVGDPLEVAAIAKAYSTPERATPVVIGSLKTNVGHTESASGITGIIKVLLSMKNEKIPPHLNLKTLNPAINLEAIPAEIPLKLRHWPKRNDGIRLAGVSSFGISGTDGHAIIQEPPLVPNQQIHYGVDRPKHILKLSAKSPQSMTDLLEKYGRLCERASLEKNGLDFANLAYSGNTGRASFNHRAVIIAKDSAEAAKIIKENSFEQREIQGKSSKLCFLFTGQGSQYPNMAFNLYETSPVFRNHFDKCDEILVGKYGVSIRDVLWGKDEAELSRTLYSQTSIFVVEYCLLKLWEFWGVTADYVMGHSLGEFAAACAAGVLDFEDALKLVAERSRLVDALPRGKMLVIKTDKQTVDKHISKFQQNNSNFWLDYAATNAPDQTVLAGDSENIEAFAQYCKQNSLKNIVLAASHAFHSRHMDPMLAEYENIASNVKKINLDKTNLPKFISGVDGKLIPGESIDKKYWVRHTREKVSFIEACKVAQEEGCSLFLEVGPHPVLSALVMANIEGQSLACLPSLRRGKEEWNILLESLGKLYLSDWKGEVDWKGFDRHYMRSRVPLPFYPFHKKPIWVKTRYCPDMLHPLLGKALPNASGKNVFESELTLKTAPFVQDHVIGKTVVFPGAAFLEMCLAGGYASAQSIHEDFTFPRKPIGLSGLQIQSPLALHDHTLCVLQTIVHLDEDEENTLGYFVKICKQEDDTGSGNHWIPHASGKFLPVALTLPSHITGNIDIPSVQSSWSSSDNKDFYKKLPEVGLRFGAQFQSLEMKWTDPKDQAVLMRVKLPEDTSKYLIHPVVADAMIQTVMLWSSKGNLRKLHVPVRIGEFIWLGQCDSKERFIYCANTSSGIGYALLVDGTGQPLAYMEGVEFAETNVKLVESIIQQQQTPMPDLWEEIYKNMPGPAQGRLTFEEGTSPNANLTLEEIKEVSRLSYNFDDENAFYKDMVHLTKLYFIQALYNLGWNPQTGTKFTTRELLFELKIQKEHLGYCHFFLKQLSHLDYLKTTAKPGFGSEFLLKYIPTAEEISAFVTSASTTYASSKEQFKLVTEIGRNMTQVLTGHVSPSQILFPNDSRKPSAEKFYKEISTQCNSGGGFLIKNKIFLPLMNAIQKEGNVESPTLRILEIGAGTGAATTKHYLHFIEKHEIVNFEYWYTDISAAFQTYADHIFVKYPKNLIFKKFNMEEDPLEQGLYPEYFDLVVAGEVLHVAKDLKKTLCNIRTLMKPGSVIQIIEDICQAPANTFVFGLLEGYWEFKDFDLRPDHCTLTGTKWKETIEICGFCNVNVVPIYQNTQGFIYAFANNKSQFQLASLSAVSESCNSWIIFANDMETLTDNIQKHLESLNRKVIVVPKQCPALAEEENELLISNAVTRSTDQLSLEGIIYSWGLSTNPNERDQSMVGLPFLSLCKKIAKMELNSPPKIFILTQGQLGIEDSDVVNPVPATVTGIAKTVFNEVSISIQHIDLCPLQSPIDQVNEILANLWISRFEPIVACRQGKRFCQRVAACKIQNDYLSIPNGCDRYQLILPKSRLINDLEYEYMQTCELAETEVEVQVKAMALNFRDVFAVLKPSKQFENLNTVGLDFTGVIVGLGSKVTQWKVGDRVIGMNTDENLSLPSHVKIDQTGIVSLPDDNTFAEGATLPAVFCTVLYCLDNVAKMQKGETLLLHTASGGVGLCAIQLAKYFGVNVIATAGSTRKRSYLRNLGIQHVFNSRTTEFGKQVLEVTNGKGVDVILNSLTGEGFKEASLSALGQNGRFIEISKLNIWTPEEVKSLRSDVFYEVVDLTKVEKGEYEALTLSMSDLLKKGDIRPLPYEMFDALNIRQALYYLQKAKHIGKVVCLMPEVKIENSKFVAQTMLFNSQSTYIITGGLGGIGLEVTKFMLSKGANHIALVSRSKPKPEIERLIKTWKSSGNHVEAFSVDIGNYEKCKDFINQLNSPTSSFPPIRGVMHAAGVLSDSILLNQTWDKFKTTFNPKVNGTWNLHDLTKDLLLEHFVLFSSMTATLGVPGQANHVASNNFQDVFAHYRKSNGLPATSIKWGNWGEVGVAIEVDFPGIRPISTKQGILVLETMLKSQRSSVAVLNVESFSLVVKLFPLLKHQVADKRLLGDTKTAVLVNTDEFWKNVDEAENKIEKINAFKSCIKSTIKNILKLEGDDEIDDNADFQTLGIDSLMMLEMKNSLQSIFASRLPITTEQLKDCSNIEMLANKFLQVLEGVDESEVKLPTIKELRELIKEDSILPSSIAPSVGVIPAKTVSELRTVLLTGVTGVLGPYVLKELTCLPQITKIVCLIRKIGKLEPMARLQRRLKVVGIADQIDLSQVECISGDIVYEGLGLSSKDYETLAESIDCVVHCAVRADHTEKYWKAPNQKKNNVRAVNVKGTERLLEFAVFKKLKHFYYASSLLAVPTTCRKGNVSEDWQDFKSLDNLTINWGYPISKFISEQHIKQAIERGVPCKVFRFGMIGGDSKTGRHDYLNAHFVLRWLAFMKLRCMPDIPMPLHIFPVDYCAKFSVEVFFNPEAPNEPYNVMHPYGGGDQTLIKIAEEMGIEIEQVSFSEFVELLKEEGDDSPLAQFKSSYEEEEECNVANFGGNPLKSLRQYLKDSNNFFRSYKMPRFIPNYNEYDSTEMTMRRDIKFLKDSGVFEKFGIN